MHQAIKDYTTDDEGHWIAVLDCGHTQHIRHQPPFQNREWVTTPEGRSEKLGATLECLFCEMPALPAQANVYSKTDEFGEATIPNSLLKAHRTKRGTWGRIVVLEGKLIYTIERPTPPINEWVLRPGVFGIIQPQQYHSVRAVQMVRFHVEFLRIKVLA